MSGPAYDPDNIFAKILRGEAPCHRVVEDDHTLVFMDIMPRSEGHALVIPKQPARNILDAAPTLLMPVFAMAQTVAKAAMRAFDADGISLAQFSEPAGGQVVFHLHVHVMPRYAGKDLGPLGVRADDAVLARNAEKLKAALASG
jgi:histidine triad (HIT) family protein